MTPEMEFFWKAIDVIVLTLGGTLLLFIMKLMKDFYKMKGEMKAQIDVFGMAVKNLKSQFNKVEAWIDAPERAEVVSTVREIHSDLVAIKAALKAHDDRLTTLEKAIAFLARRIGVSINLDNKH